MITKEPIRLDQNFNDILTELEESRDHYFITGRAGTGKSTLLQVFRNTTKKKAVVLAPTGVAALNVKGQTIHSFFGFPPKLMDRGEIQKRRFRKLYESLDAIIIDEISMVRADLIDHIDFFLRLNRSKDIPFGGVQMILFGDLFQLPPVVATPFEKNYFRTTYRSPYFFDAHIFQEDHMARMITIELHKVYRQEHRAFVQLLDAIRLNEIDFDDLEYLNERYIDGFIRTEGYITLCARNHTAQNINKVELQKINEPEYQYAASVEGNFDPRLYPTDYNLKLKVGAQVMLIKNDPTKKFVNGTIAKIETLSEHSIGISFEDHAGEKVFIDLDKASWEIVKYNLNEKSNIQIEAHVVGVFKQFPIKLAWAVTIHKSQGKTFDKVIINLGKGAFEHGQTYVALSRCRTLEGVVLTKQVQPRDIMVDPVISNYYQDNF